MMLSGQADKVTYHNKESMTEIASVTEAKLNPKHFQEEKPKFVLILNTIRVKSSMNLLNLSLQYHK